MNWGYGVMNPWGWKYLEAIKLQQSEHHKQSKEKQKTISLTKPSKKISQIILAKQKNVASVFRFNQTITLYLRTNYSSLITPKIVIMRSQS